MTNILLLIVLHLIVVPIIVAIISLQYGDVWIPGTIVSFLVGLCIIYIRAK